MAPKVLFAWKSHLGALCLVLALCQDIHHASAAEHVRFESARSAATEFQLRRARERGEEVRSPPADIIDGFLAKPAGEGPFAAVALFHGCGGLSESTRSGAESFWVRQLVGWGYATLVVDSFSSRGVEETCSGRTVDRLADAFGALDFLSNQPFVDPGRVAAMGFSAGGSTALSVTEPGTVDQFEGLTGRRFKASVAFYPDCSPRGEMTAPALVLVGELDDWTPASACRDMIMGRNDTGSRVSLIVYPGAYHGFDRVRFQPGVSLFGHWLEYNAAAAAAATKDVRSFLAASIAP